MLKILQELQRRGPPGAIMQLIQMKYKLLRLIQEPVTADANQNIAIGTNQPDSNYKVDITGSTRISENTELLMVQQIY